jgi:hypothetical protein
MVTRIVKLTFKPENVSSFLQLFDTVKQHIASFPGCDGVKLYRDLHHDNVYFTYSHWDTDQSLQAYRQSALFDDTWTKTKALFGDKPQAWSLIEAEKNAI